VLTGRARTPSLAGMAEVPRQHLFLCALAVVAVALIGARYLKQEGGGGSAAARPHAPVRVRESGGGQAFVHVTGAVRRPGVYRVPAWARLDFAVKRAGGAAAGANLEGVNLAAKIADGQQVVVPRKGAAGAASGELGVGDPAGGPSGPVSLNTATPEQLDQLEGVGPATAQKILEWRKQHGGFRSVDDLKQITGIGPKKFAALKDKVGM
jgi:competence protein ComEA